MFPLSTDLSFFQIQSSVLYVFGEQWLVLSVFCKIHMLEKYTLDHYNGRASIH